MPKHSFVNSWLHIVWSTKERFPYFSNEMKAKQTRLILIDICNEKEIYLRESYVNPDHVHLLISMPIGLSIKDILQNLKGISSHEINKNNLFKTRFAWARGYAAFSVSSSTIEKVTKYIKNQKEHHRRKSFTEEWEEFMNEYKRIRLNR